MDGRPMPLALRSLRELATRAARQRFTGDLIVRDRSGMEHHATFRYGVLVDVRISGHFDPILSHLLDDGALSPERFVEVLEALGRSRRRAGDLAREAGVLPAALRSALDAQGERRFAALVRIARDRGREALLSSRDVRASEASFRLSVLPLVDRYVPKGTRPPAPRKRAPRLRKRGPIDKSALRRLAFALHPDRHAHKSDAEREALARRLAEATAAYHGLKG